MTFPEAIKDLTDMKKVLRSLLPPHEQRSLDFAIEALKRQQQWKESTPDILYNPLPGETED